MKVKRMWVNQPSVLQPCHQLHGTLVLAEPYTDQSWVAHFLGGDTVSAVLPRASLSEGWPQHLRQRPAVPGEEVQRVLAELVDAVRSMDAQSEVWMTRVDALCAQADAVLDSCDERAPEWSTHSP